MTELPDVHIVSVLYNSAPYLPGYLEALERLDYPAERLFCTLVDNGSTDQAAALLAARAGRIRRHLFRSERNLGFAAGNNMALRTNRAEYVLLLNVDTEIDPSCLARLVARMSADPRIGLCEARQVPHEHPKEYVPETGETPWCSAACLLVRSRALRDTGLFDERFFLYCEDVDLSWRMWHQGWKCVYEPEAACKHYTLDLAAHKRGSHDEFFFGVRNGILLRVLYGSFGTWLRYLASVLRLILFARGLSPAEKRLLVRALRGQVRHFPHLMVRRRQLRGARRRSPWIRFYGWDYHRLRHAPGAAPAAGPGAAP